MARVKCVMMQRDETLLLEPWFLHYGHLFGFENLVVLDNGSTDVAVLATLECYEQKGVRVIRGLDHPADPEKGRPSDFALKGEYARQVIAAWDRKAEYDFAFPVDCDEFLAVYTDGGYSAAKEDIHAALDELIGEQRVMQIRYSPGNVPGVPGCFMPMNLPKRFVARNTVGLVDLGYHAITSRAAEGVRETRLSYLHMHHKPFDMVVRHAERKLCERVDMEDRDALRRFDGPGKHLVDYFFMTEDDYLTRFAADGVYYRFPGVLDHFYTLGVRSEFFGTIEPVKPQPARDLVELVRIVDRRINAVLRFAVQSYLTRYPDVAASDMPPFYHYFAFGRGEGRKPD
ncbi:glycosyltransferase family 2 protein [Acetobacter sp.]|uniref:glycosyltransferase family 2 protein n=1 Tax=Acetobacter sp. TaxID=440 RepID=UPI0039E8FE7C